MGKISREKLTIAAVGDISFAGPNADNPSIDIFKPIIPVFNLADLVIANLEGPLIDEQNPVQGKCTIRGGTGWAGILKKAGIRIVSLANNHIMDHGEPGLISTLSALEKEGVRTVGAGSDIIEAGKPLYIEVRGYRIAILARTAVIVDSPSYAGRATPGVAFLNIESLVASVKECSKQADTVVLILHWGVEHYEYPTPQQKEQARELIEAGADLIFGHHPHIIQGVERFERGYVSYSLGNFIFDEFYWDTKSGDGSNRKHKLTLKLENRNGMILNAKMQERQIKVDQIFTCIEMGGSVSIDKYQNRNTAFKTLCDRLKRKDYNRWWKIYALKKEWDLRLRQRMNVKKIASKIYDFKLEEAQELFLLLRNSLRISGGKTTNPYEKNSKQ